jgi:hypothetical protein
MIKSGLTALAAACALALAGGAHATIWTGTAYFTRNINPQVDSITYTYDDVAHLISVGAPKEIEALPSADGLLFAPGGKTILVGGGFNNQVYTVPIGGGSFTTNTLPGPGSDHLALHGASLYTSGPYGQSNAPLISATVKPDGTLANIASTTVTGGDTQVTQLVFADGKVFYDNGQPNCCADVGTIDLSTGVTTQIAANVRAAHGMAFDPYTGLIDLFGAAWAGTINPKTNAIKQAQITIDDFDQGAPDGFGHALIAGGGGITFVDYRASRDITAPTAVFFVPGFIFDGIDAIAPIVGAGSIPEPATWAMMLLGLGAIGAALRRRRRSLALT